jgi:hypothetical protein
MKSIAIIALSVFCLGALESSAKDEIKSNPFTETLQHIPAAELPAKAAQLVKSTRTPQRETVTVDVVKAAVEINPAAAPAIVGAIARAVPEMASVAAATAATEQPKQASAIARAATAAAPSMAGQIVAAVCRSVPDNYRAVAIAASQAAPGSGKEILSGVAAAIPALQPFITDRLAGYSGSPSVANTLNLIPAATPSSQPVSVTPMPSATFSPGPIKPPASSGSAIGPSFIPISSTPSNAPPDRGGSAPPGGGGRDYARP